MLSRFIDNATFVALDCKGFVEAINRLLEFSSIQCFKRDQLSINVNWEDPHPPKIIQVTWLFKHYAHETSTRNDLEDRLLELEEFLGHGSIAEASLSTDLTKAEIKIYC